MPQRAAVRRAGRWHRMRSVSGACRFRTENVLAAAASRLERPAFSTASKCAYLAMLFTTPYIACSVLVSLGYIFLRRGQDQTSVPKLPPYPDPAKRERLFVVLGEVHHAKRPDPVEHPRWLMIPERGLYTGIAVFGAIGSGKTSGCMYPFAEQILSIRAGDPRAAHRRARSRSERRLLSQGARDPREARPRARTTSR